MINNLPANAGDGRTPVRQEGPLEQGMATHSSILAWRIPWTEEPGRLQSMGSQRVGHNWSNLACTHIITKATENQGESQRNRSNMESELARPCYKSHRRTVLGERE